MITPSHARAWYDRWELQQERYAGARTARMAAVVDSVRSIRPNPMLIVDIGCGPGRLAADMVAAFPRARVMAVDQDPLLLALGRAVHAAVEFRRVDVGSPGWSDALRLRAGTVDAIVSSTALHYPAPVALERIYSDSAGLVRPGGVLVNADEFPLPDGAAEDEDSGDAASGAVPSRGVPDAAGESWQAWWEAVAAEPAFAGLLEMRAALVPAHGHDNGLGSSAHRVLLTRSGFRSAAVTWRRGTSSVIMAQR